MPMLRQVKAANLPKKTRFCRRSGTAVSGEPLYKHDSQNQTHAA